MAKVVDVTDVPELPGAGMLHFDDGRPPLMALPEIANEHRERLGMSAMRDGVAGPGGGTPEEGFLSKVWNGHTDAQKDLNAQVPLGGKLAQPAAPQAPAAPAAPVTAPPPAPVPQQGAGGATPAPVDPAQAAQDERLRQIQLTGRLPGGGGGPARPAGFAPDVQKTVTEHGPAYDIQAAGDRLDAGAGVLNAQLSKAATEKQLADANAARAAAQNLQAQQHLGDLARDTAVKTANFQAREKGFQNDMDRYTQSAQPDPNHFIASRGVVANIFGAIGQGLGAFGASLNHTQNYAFDYVQSQIKADIAAQEERYRAGRADKKDALARFVENYHGDMDMAKAAMLQAQNKVAETETNNFAAQAQSKEVSANAQVLAAQFQQQQLLAEQQRAELAQGKTTTTTEDKFHQASGGTGGGKPLTLAEELAVKKATGPGKDQGALGMTAQGVARQKANYSTKTEALATFADSLSHRATLMGIHFDPKTGELTNGKDKPAQESDLNIPVGAGYVGKRIAGDVLTPKAMELRRAEENSVRLRAAAVYNHSISAEEGATEVDKTIGSTDAAKLANMRYLAEEYRKRKLAIDTGAASIDPRLVNDRDEAERAVNYARATGAPLPGPRPRAGAANGDTASDAPDSDGGP